MKQSDLKTQLKKAFQEEIDPLHNGKELDIKQKLMEKINKYESEQEEAYLLKKLRRFYRPANTVSKAQIKSTVMTFVKTIDPEESKDYSEVFVLYMRKTLASSFAFILLFTLIIGPFQTLGPADVIPAAKAVFLECDGNVFLNGNLCKSGDLSIVEPGDDIITKDSSTAIIFYPNYKIVRLDNDTEAVIDENNVENLFIETGSVWLNSPAELGNDSLKVSTPILKAKIPQGSVGVTSIKNTTKFFTTTAAVEVQIENKVGSTEMITIPPQKNMVIRKNRRNALVRETRPDEKKMEWVMDNSMKDKQYIEVVKERAVDDSKDVAGVIPGTFRNYFSNIANQTINALTWNQESRLEMSLSDLDKTFAVILVYLKEGDQTTAIESFEVYREKIVSLLVEESDIMPLENSGDQESKVVKMLQKHNRLVSLFSQEDSEYLLKDYLQQLSLEINQETETEES